jgi:superfamily II DNA/RNA helicase
MHKFITRAFSIPVTRTSSNFTFATKYPRKHVQSRLALEKPSKKDTLVKSLASTAVQQKFTEMALDDTLIQGLKHCGFNSPSQIQQLMIPHILANPHKNVLCGSQTGSGKTLGYLLPLMHLLKEQERAQDDLERKRGRPRAVVLVPSRHLVEQVTSVAKGLSHFCKLRILGLHGRSKQVTTSLSSPVDILITTASTLQKLIGKQQLTLSMTSHYVLDEADTLFDSHFEEDVQPLLQHAKRVASTQNKTCSFILVTATFPKTLESALESEFSDISRLTASSLHRIPSNLKQDFMRLDGSTTKPNLLLEVIKRGSADTNRMMIFCNKKDTVETVYEHLQSKQIGSIKLSSMLPASETRKDFAKFVDPKANPEFMACVCTDMGSRGIDTTSVGHVVLYEFPTTVIDYIHRVGRTARFGRGGRATSLLMQKDLALASSIKQSAQNRKQLS